MENERENALASFPNHVTQSILERLPLKSAVRSCTVSKSWLEMIGFSEARPRILFTALTCDNPDKTFYRWFHYVLQEKQPELLGQHQVSLPRLACEPYLFALVSQTLLGLVCCQNYIGQSVICNLNSGKFIDLPKVDVIFRGENANFFLGYDQEEFKVLCVNSSAIRMESQVLTLLDENSSWRKLDCDIPPHIPAQRRFCSDGKVYYGAFSWTEVGCFFVMCFDLKTEKFSKIDAPKESLFDTLLIINNKLALVRNYPPLNQDQPLPNHPPPIWIFENQTWSELPIEFPSFSEVTTGTYICIGTIGNDKFIFTPRLLAVGDDMHVIYYDPQEKRLEKIIIPGTFPEFVGPYEAFLDYTGDPKFSSIEAIKDKIFSNATPMHSQN